MPELKSERRRITPRFIYLSFLSKWDSCPTKLSVRTMYKCCYSTICWTTEMTVLACSPMKEKVVYPPGRCGACWISRDLCLSKGFPKWRSSTSTRAVPREAPTEGTVAIPGRGNVREGWRSEVLGAGSRQDHKLKHKPAWQPLVFSLGGLACLHSPIVLFPIFKCILMSLSISLSNEE